MLAWLARWNRLLGAHVGLEILSVRVDGDELDLGTRKINFRKRFFRVKQRPVRVPVRKRPTTDDS